MKHDTVKESAEFTLGPVKLKITTRQIALFLIMLLVVSIILFMTIFPNYQREIYGNQTVPIEIKHIFVSFPVLVFVVIIVFTFLTLKNSFDYKEQ